MLLINVLTTYGTVQSGSASGSSAFRVARRPTGRTQWQQRTDEREITNLRRRRRSMSCEAPTTKNEE